MLSFNVKDVLLGQKAATKEQAIGLIGELLHKNGKVAPEYTQGLLERESQTSTYLENGIAIPHGSVAARQYVQETGVVVVQFPEGIQWNEDGDVAHVCFGIASRSSEHLDILKSIMLIVDDEDVCKTLATTTDETEFLTIIRGGKAPVDFTCRNCLSLETTADSLDVLAMTNGINLLNYKAISTNFIKNLAAPVYLDKGIWLNSAAQGNLENCFAYAQTTEPFEHQGRLVKGLITIALANNSNKEDFAVLTSDKGLEVFAQTTTCAGDILRLFDLKKKAVCGCKHGRQIQEPSQGGCKIKDLSAPAVEAPAAAPAPVAAPATPAAEATPVAAGDVLTAEFTIENEHGIHARPATFLVSVCKQFECKISVQNLTTNSAVVNAKSMMKIVALSATHGSQLRFSFDGADAQQALAAVTKAITVDHLGE